MSFREWYASSWFSCEKYAERMTRAMDQPLPARERLGYLFHFYWCFTCRRVRRQLLQVESLLTELRDASENESASSAVATDEQLSDQARLRIRQALRDTEGQGGR